MRNIVVIDLNVFVRALLTSGIDKEIYAAIKKNKIVPAFFSDLFKNLTEVLLRPHLKLDIKDIKGLLEIIRTNAIMIEPEAKITACRDGSDNIILETAVAVSAEAIISNDPDLLILNPFNGIPILTPRHFLRTLKK